MNVVLSPAAKTVQDRPPSSFESFRHLVEPVERDDRRSEATHVVAIVVLEVVDAP